ncbi:Rieske (2Fe-2S) protein [Armatimonas sp.]|uniref:Rieske (2Fe-2S) protein n=1 Tax=Armatimonas sp. TaxID=1872638 RepID=UPI003753DCE5
MSDYKLGSIDQIPPGEGREFLVRNIKLAVFHLRDGSVYATQAECPHRQGPLADGLTGNGIVVCPFHAWKFALATGLPVFGECSIQTYPARLEGTELLVSISE